MNNNPDTYLTLLQSILLILAVLLALAALYGLLLLIHPRLGLQLNQLLGRRYLTRRVSGFMDRQFHIERYFYRHAKLYGLLLVVGSGYLLYRLLFDFPLENYAGIMPAVLTTDVWAWLLETLRIFLIVIGVFTLYIGLVVLIRPSNIKGLETQANRWISTRQKLAAINRTIPTLDSVAERAPRLFGGIVFLAAVTLLFVML